MKKEITPRIQKAIDIFLDSLNEGTLVSGDCSACAVGNLIAHGKGYKIKKFKPFLFPNSDSFGWKSPKGDSIYSNWNNLFVTLGSKNQVIYKSQLGNPDIIDEIESTDFTWEELAKIENAFEMNTQYHNHDYYKLSPEQIRQDQIKGLEAVIEVMMGFDDVKEDVKDIFTSKAEMIKC